MHSERYTSKTNNVWKEIEEAVAILAMCRTYTQIYTVPEEQWYEFVTILTTLKSREDIPTSIKNVINSLLEVCPHGKDIQKDCEVCWDKSMEWV